MAKNREREKRTLRCVSLTTTRSNHPREKQLGKNMQFKNRPSSHPPKKRGWEQLSERITHASAVKMTSAGHPERAPRPALHAERTVQGNPGGKRHPSSILLAPLVPPTGRAWHRARGPAEVRSAEPAPCDKIGGNVLKWGELRTERQLAHYQHSCVSFCIDLQNFFIYSGSAWCVYWLFVLQIFSPTLWFIF